MKILKQPTNYTCGQTCVAMLAGITVEKAIEVVDKKGDTSGNDLIKALNKLNIKCSDRLERSKGKLPKLAIIKYTWKNRIKEGSHWILCNNGKFYNPYYGVLDSPFTNDSYNWQKIVSYIEIYK